MRIAMLPPLLLTGALAAAWILLGPVPLGAALAILLAALGAARRPGPTLALLAALAPGIDLLLGLLLQGRVGSGNPALPTWVEPLALGFALGLLVRRSRRAAPGGPGGAGGGLLLAAVIASSGLALVRVWAEWGPHLPAFLALAVRDLPAHDSRTSEHLLRAALLLIAPVGWLALLHREPEEALFGTRFWRGMTAGPLLAGGLAAVLNLSGSAGARVFLDDKNADGSLLLLSLFGALHLARRDPAPWGRRLALIEALASALLLLRTGSRTAMLAGALGALVLAGSQILAGRGRLGVARGKASWMVAGAVVVLAIGLLVSPIASGRSRPWGQYLEVNRFGVWDAAVRAAASEPLLGLGPGQLYRLLGAFHSPDPPPFVWLPPRENAHNQVLQVAAEAGLLGAGGFLLLLGTALARAWRARPHGDLPCLPIGASVYALTLMSGHSLLLSRQVLLFWTFLAAAGALRYGPASAAPAARGSRPLRMARFAPWVLAALGLLLSLPARPLPCGSPHETADGVRWELAAGFYDEEAGPEGTWQWMKDVGQIRFCNDTARTAPLPGPFRVASFVVPRRLALFPDPGFSPSAIPLPPVELTLPERDLPPGGHASLLLLPEPGAVSIQATLGTADRRRVSLRCAGPRAFPSPAGQP